MADARDVLARALEAAITEYRSAEDAYALDAFTSTLRASGLAVVPVEPTEEMVEAGYKKTHEMEGWDSDTLVAATWAAMLAAAPMNRESAK